MLELGKQRGNLSRNCPTAIRVPFKSGRRFMGNPTHRHEWGLGSNS